MNVSWPELFVVAVIFTASAAVVTVLVRGALKTRTRR